MVIQNKNYTNVQIGQIYRVYCLVIKVYKKNAVNYKKKHNPYKVLNSVELSKSFYLIH
jgi:hypothetical protein